MAIRPTHILHRKNQQIIINVDDLPQFISKGWQLANNKTILYLSPNWKDVNKNDLISMFATYLKIQLDSTKSLQDLHDYIIATYQVKPLEDHVRT